MGKELVVPHAVYKAAERYGLRLNWSDIYNMCDLCMQGYGRLAYERAECERHNLIYNGKAMHVIYRPPTAGRPKGVIVTILPPASAIKHNKEALRAIRDRKRS